jgi:N-methylhydantoinase B/oxoprolinase/acetone carboxylase alpha subunit
MIHARTRRELLDEMIHEYDEPLVMSLVNTIVEQADKSCSEAVEMVIDAWQHSKGHSIEEFRPRQHCQKEEMRLN